MHDDKVMRLLAEIMDGIQREGVAASMVVEQVERAIKRVHVDPSLLDKALVFLQETEAKKV